MDAITYSAARANLAKTMDRVCDEHEPIIIEKGEEDQVRVVAEFVKVLGAPRS